MSAYAALERLRRLASTGQLVGAPCELASQSICTALVALDECAFAVLKGPARGTSVPSGGWRESLLTLYFELGLLT